MSEAAHARIGTPGFAFDEMQNRYSDALLSYLVEPGEPSLLSALNFGEAAVEQGLGLREMAAIHH